MTSIVADGSDNIDMASAVRLQEPGTLVVNEQLSGAAGRRAQVSAYERRFTLTLDVDVRNGVEPGCAGHHAQSLRVTLALQRPASCTIERRGCGGAHAWAAAWDLTVNDAHDPGPFEEACSWVERELRDEEIDDHDPALRSFYDGGDTGDSPAARHARRRMSEICEYVSARAITMCDPPARHVALRLPREARFFAYVLLAEDPSGRVAQMIDICPSVFVIGALVAPYSATSGMLLAAIRDGCRLSELLDLLLPAAQQFIAARSSFALPASVKALIRRAPAMRAHDLLEALQAPGIDVNDLARAGDLSKEWFDVMAAWTRNARGIDDEIRRTNIGGFLSKHGAAVAQTAYAESFIKEMLDWLECTRSQPPSRRSSPTAVRRAIDTWHANIDRYVAHDPETRLAVGPTATRDIAGIEVYAIETVGDLMAEGLAMHHCVAAFADAAVAGQLYFYRALIERQRVTIAVEGLPKQWSLREAAGFANRRLDSSEMTLVHRWIGTLP